ncbi:MAG: hypothetical protein K0S12_800, partial [Bacteroidetes bacterium]|nr:hypothetical protein [Bacteroidota bacterium]
NLIHFFPDLNGSIDRSVDSISTYLSLGKQGR